MYFLACYLYIDLQIAITLAERKKYERKHIVKKIGFFLYWGNCCSLQKIFIRKKLPKYKLLTFLELNLYLFSNEKSQSQVMD